MSNNPPFGGSIAAEALLRLSPNDRRQAAEPSCPAHRGDQLWLVQYRDHTTNVGTFDSGLGCTTNWTHARHSWQRDWPIVAYQFSLADRDDRFRQVQNVCNEISHGFGKWSPKPMQNGGSDVLVGTSDNCEFSSCCSVTRD